MVTYREVAKRHMAYASALLGVIAVSKYAWFLCMFLLALLAGLWQHHGTPVAFVGLTLVATPLMTGLCVNLSAHTWWYAQPMDLLGVPPWLFPLHGILAHWVLDAYFLVTLQEVRKITLP